MAQEEGERPNVRPHHPPMYGEIVEIDDDSVTIAYIEGDHPVPQHMADVLDLETGDELTFVINEQTRMHTESGEDLVEGDMAYIGVFRHDDVSYARVISDRLPPRAHRVGAVVSIDTDANEIVDGEQVTVTYSDDTVFQERSEDENAEVSEDSVEVGDHLVIRGHYDKETESGEIRMIQILEPIDWSEVDPGQVEHN